MNFIWGIPGIQIIGAYMSGCPLIYKGHPFSAITNTTIIRMLIAAGADPRFVHKLEGFGKGIATLAGDPRVAVVSVTGSSETAKTINSARGLARTRFEGGGCNWSFVDDGYTDAEITKIAERLTYSKLGFSSHKCTSLHGVTARRETLNRLEKAITAEMDTWEVRDPRGEGVKIAGPLMVHTAQTAIDIVTATEKAGGKILRRNARATGDYGDHAQAVTPGFIEVTPELTITIDWDGKGPKTFAPSSTEFFMPVLVAMEMPDFEGFLRFCTFTNPHDLSTSVWSRDDRKLQRGRRIIGGMLKENDGTDSAMEWEEFGARSPMRLDHLLASDPLGAPLRDEHVARAEAVLKAFHFTRDGDARVLDETFPWVTIEDDGGLWRVHVATPLPRHLWETVSAVLDGLVREAGLVRIDPLTRRAMEPGEWVRRLALVKLDTPPRGRL
jgi:acyl-CoA reductase-like NAD-dependent aldehyde dehydrogenase